MRKFDSYLHFASMIRILTATLACCLIFLTSHSAVSIVVKYAERDGLSGLANLQKIARSYPSASKKIVFPAGFSKPTSASRIIEQVSAMKFGPVFSDSLYNALNTGDRSQIWMYRDGELGYESVLSEFSLKAARDALSASSKASGKLDSQVPTVNLPSNQLRNYQLVKHSQGFAFLESNILVKYSIDKAEPELIHLDSLGSGDVIYQLHLGENYRDSLAAIKAFYRAQRVPFSIKYYSPLFVGDTTFYMAFAPVYVQVSDTNSTEPSFKVRQIGALIGTVKSRIVVSHRIHLDYLNVNAQPTKYQIFVAALMRSGSDFIIPVWKTRKADIGTENALVGRFAVSPQNNVVLKQFGAYQLPEMQRRNSLGYNLLTFKSSDGLILTDNDNVVYDVDKDATYSLNIFRRLNSVDASVFNSRAPQLAFTILDMQRTKTGLRLLYTEDNRLYQASLRISGKTATLVRKTELLKEFPTRTDKYPALFLNDNVIVFDPETRRFESVDH